MRTKTWYVEKANLLHKLTAEEIGLFEGEGSPLLLDRGEQLSLGLEPSRDCVYIVLSGYAKLVTMNDEGRRFSISILQTGDFLGGLPGTERDNSADPQEFLEMMAPSRLLRIASQRFQQVLTSNPTLYLSVFQILQGNSRKIQRKLSDLLFKDVYARIAQLFLELTFDHGIECPYAFGLCRDLNLKHHEIAELIGASRPVTSVAMGRLHKADLIHKHDGLICLNHMNGLQQVAEGGMPALEMLESRQLLVS